MLKMLDLFAGIGGASLAGDRLGIETTQFVEINPDAQQVLRYNFPNVPIHDDIRTYHPTAGEFDIIWSSFPCTGTSNAGTRTGLKHPASSLWQEGLRCLIEAQPCFCIIEQRTSVRSTAYAVGASKMLEGVIKRGLRPLLGGLSLAGYAWEIGYVTARELGAGHQRLRLFIISYPDEQRILYEQQTCWSDQMQSLVQRQRADSQWLTVRNEGDAYGGDRNRTGNGLSVGASSMLLEAELLGRTKFCVRGSNTTVLEESDYTEHSRTPGRIRARYLAGRTVTLYSQAAIALRRVLYLNSII